MQTSDNPIQGGWHQPEELKGKGLNVWYQPAHAWPLEKIQALAPAPRPEVSLNPVPDIAGGWYLPSTLTETSPEAPSEAELGLFAVVEGMNTQEVLAFDQNLGTFDPSRSRYLYGIVQGEFDAQRSGALPGIGAEPAPVPFDESKSGVLTGIGAEPAPAPFDESKSGVLAGISAEPAPAPFDESKSGQLAGLGAAEAGATIAPLITDSQAVAVPTVDKYAEVEKQVGLLRQQFSNGQLSRDQLQAQLRGLMQTDEQGRWWMLGMESNQWYRYDGANWVKDNPPRPAPTAPQNATEGAFVASAQATPTTYGEQAFVVEGTPLPSRVPVEDPNATLVNQRAVQLEEHRSYEAPTQASMQSAAGYGVEAGFAVAGVSSPTPDAAGYTPQEGLPPQASEPLRDPNILPSGTRMVNNQPDYSAALKGYGGASGLRKWAVRAMIFGTLGLLLLAFLTIIGMLVFYFSVVNEYSDAIANIGQRAASFETTIIYDAQGNILGEFNDPRGGARKSVALEDISPYLIHATISTEDETFYENQGFSIYGIIRAIVRNLQTGGAGGGASTITQQLTRALVLDPELARQRTNTRKIQEIIVAAEIARRYSKNEILEFYLNEIYYGNLAYGIEAASETYFGKPARDLNIAEAAFLAGLPQAPAVYDPVVRREAAVNRMGDVLRLMTEATGDGCLNMQHEPYNTQPFCVTQDDIENLYAVEVAQVQVKTFSVQRNTFRYPHFVNYVWQQLERDYSAQRIYSSGFRVYTTLVPSIQDAAQQAVLEEIPLTPRANNGAVVVMDTRTGAVLSLVGSADFNNNEIDGQVNVAFTPQQPGSTLKPFVYLTAFEGAAGQPWFPGTILWDVPSDFGGYQPTNYDFSYNGPMSVRNALVRSMNIPAVKGLNAISLDAFQQTLDRFGIETPGTTVQQGGLPSALGAIDVYLFELTQAYGALANGGVRHNPYAIARILDKNGQTLYEAEENPSGTAVARPEHVYLITHILSDPTIRETASFNLADGRPTAAKTGTTNDNRDALTIGYIPQVVIGVWVGRTDNQPMGSNVFGSNTAAPIWNKTMTAAVQALQLPREDFPRPAEVADYNVCSYTGAIYAPETCPSGISVREVALASAPPSSAGFLTTLEVDSFTGKIANENCAEYKVLRSFVAIDDPFALQWLNTNPNGQAWAAQRGISLPVASPPSVSCAPGEVRPRVVFTRPVANQEVSGLTEIRGTASAPGFQSYTFLVSPLEANPPQFTGAQQTYTTQQAGTDSFLGSYDFSGLPNGFYTLRLEVTGQDGGKAYADLPVRVNNTAPSAPLLAPTTDPNLLVPTPSSDGLLPPVEIIPVPTTAGAG